ncbi:MAG: hypothetical protein J6Y48_05965, partial [Clostridia bacterium]|nr:hypothetical protein [Clostridia bacterium]
MRKLCSLLFAILFSLLYISAAMAETRTFSIKELPEVTSPRWKQTYEAHGRTIDVDVDITVPEADTAPVLKVCRAPVLEDPLRSELAEEYEKADKKDKKHYYYFESDDYSTYIQHAIPPLAGKTKNDMYNAATMRENVQDLPRYDENQAYAYNNKLTVKQAAEVVVKNIQAFFPDTELWVDTVYIGGETYYRKNNKHISDLGYYDLNMTQCFRGIPFITEIRNAYWDRRKDELNFESFDKGTVAARIYSDSAWLFNACLYQESGTVCEDIPLLPFDAVKEKIEALILSGHIRWINSVSLGYVQYATMNPKEQVLLPSWVVWTEYHPDGPESESS